MLQSSLKICIERESMGRFFIITLHVVRENEDKGVTKTGTTLVFVYKIDKNVLF